MLLGNNKIIFFGGLKLGFCNIILSLLRGDGETTDIVHTCSANMYVFKPAHTYTLWSVLNTKFVVSDSSHPSTQGLCLLFLC